MPVQTSSALDFSKYISERTEHFAGRQWVFQAIEDWLATKDSERYFWLTAEPGAGKTAISARLWQLARKVVTQPGLSRIPSGSLRAVHFCSARDGMWIDPRMFAQSVALQLSSIPAFAKALVQVGDRTVNINIQYEVQKAAAGATVSGLVIKSLDLSGLKEEPAFNRVLTEPLQRIYTEGFSESIEIIVDALDESLSYTGQVTIADLLSRLESLSPQVRFIITSRPNPKLDGPFSKARPFYLSGSDKQSSNQGDIDAFLQSRFQQEPKLLAKIAGWTKENLEALLRDIGNKADGNFQYVTFLLKDIAGQRSPTDLAGIPPGLDGLYLDSLNRTLALNASKDWLNDLAPAMGVLSVAQEPLSLRQLKVFTGLPEIKLVGAMTVLNQFVEKIPTPGNNGSEDRFRLFHQSIIDFVQKINVKLNNNEVLNTFYLPPSEWHGKIGQTCIDRFGHAWPVADEYGLRYTATHLTQAAFASEPFERAPWTRALSSLFQDKTFRSVYLDRIGDVAAFQHDMEQALKVASLDVGADAVRQTTETALALVAFRRDEVRPEPLLALARQGDLKRAVRRLEISDLSADWAQAVYLVIAWLAADINKPEASALRDRVSASAPKGQLKQLLDRVNVAIDATPWIPPEVLPPPRSPDELETIVQRMGGGGVNAELLQRGSEMTTKSGYLASEDGGPLVAFAAANPHGGDRYLREYVGVHTSYHYVTYRNESLWILLRFVLLHPDPVWTRDMVATIASAALAGSQVEFQEELPTALRGLEALSGSIASMAELDSIEQRYAPSSKREPDTWGRQKRQASALTEVLSVLFNRPADAILENALGGRWGFAGFRWIACLRVAEAVRVCSPWNAVLLDRALGEAEQAAHNIQDSLFCARMTARFNGLRAYHSPKVFPLRATVEKFLAEPRGADFAPLHLIGEQFSKRKGSEKEKIPLSAELLAAGSLAEVADAFHQPVAALEELNRGNNWDRAQKLPTGTMVRIPDKGFAPWLAARFSADLLTDASVSQFEKVDLIKRLIPVAALSPTALDTVLARLLLAVRPADPVLIGQMRQRATDAKLPIIEAGEANLPS